MLSNSLSKIKVLLLDVFFPKFCVNCGREGSYLCLDCFSLIDIADIQYCPFCFPTIAVADGKTCQKCRRERKLTGLYCAASYEDLLVQKMLRLFKYAPFAREISENLSLLIYSHFLKLGVRPDFFKQNNFALTPVPLRKKRLRLRGYNQAEEIAKHLSEILEIPLYDCLAKTKQTVSQTELSREKRRSNVANSFEFKAGFAQAKGKNILLVDDISTTGSTLDECSRVLRKSGCREIWGVVVARGQ